MEGDLPQVTSLAEALVGLAIAIIVAVSVRIGYTKLMNPDPPAVSASMIETKIAERLTASFEALARVIERDSKLREECNDLREEGNRLLSEHNRQLSKVMEQTEGTARDIRELAHQVRRSVEK